MINVSFLENAPTGFHGMVIKNPDESYTILLDPNDSRLQNLKTYKHEMEHILRDDFSQYDIQDIERLAHEQDIQAELLRRNRET